MPEDDFFQWEQTSAARPGHAAVIAIDPGSFKCGMAVVCDDGVTIYRAVCSTACVVDEARTLILRYAPLIMVLGKGTGSKPLLTMLSSADLGIPIELMDESHTTEEARKRFLTENPARGWSRLIPAGLRTPDRSVDDYAAVILAERYWRRTGTEAGAAKPNE